MHAGQCCSSVELDAAVCSLRKPTQGASHQEDSHCEEYDSTEE